VPPLTPALLRRELNCIGSASLKGASLAGSAHMIFASSHNFKRGRRKAGTRPASALARVQASCGIASRFHQFAMERPPRCRIGPYTRPRSVLAPGPTKISDPSP
jgi:hypothetical protein